MAVAYHAPPCLSCASLMADDPFSPSSSSSRSRLLPNHSLSCSRAFRWSRARSPASIQYGIPIEMKKRRRKVTCSFSDTPEVVTACSWNQLVLCSDIPVVVEFWASWCGPCRMVSRVLDEIARDYSGRVKCLKIDTDEYPQVADTHGIQRIPTVLLFKNAEQVKSITGTLPTSVYVTAIEEMLAE